MTATDEKLYMIWSNEHAAWWRPNRCGYTVLRESAGLYELSEAIKICNSIQSGPIPNEIPILRDIADSMTFFERLEEMERTGRVL